MKYIKRFNESVEYNMDDYLWLPLFCIREFTSGSRTLNCGIFNDQNLGGYGLGIRGDYFSQTDFEKAMSKKGDSVKRKLYTADELNILIKDLGFDNLSKDESIQKVVDMIKKDRGNHVSVDVKGDKYADLHVSLDEIEKMAKFI